MRMTVLTGMLLVVGATFAADLPILKEGEKLSDGRVCHGGIVQLISRNPDVYGCDFDEARSAARIKRFAAERLAQMEGLYERFRKGELIQRADCP